MEQGAQVAKAKGMLEEKARPLQRTFLETFYVENLPFNKP